MERPKLGLQRTQAWVKDQKLRPVPFWNFTLVSIYYVSFCWANERSKITYFK